MQYQVPQFIDTEDKLVGPFSLRQFIYVGAAGMLCGICYFFVQTWLFVIVAIIALGGALALAFLKINGRPLIKVATAAFNYYWKPQTYVWKQDHPVVAQHKQVPAASVRALPPLVGRNDEQHRPSIFARRGADAPAAANAGGGGQHGGSGRSSGSDMSAAAPASVSSRTSASTPTSTPASTPMSAPTSAPTSAPASPTTVAAAAPASASAENTRELPPVQEIARGDSLHKSWENLQTGTPEARKTSDRQFLEKKMAERYQIFQRQSGDRAAARRVDYR